jgi:aspartate ammonia-lyase
MNTRLERDSLGEKEVPADALYGIQTARAIDNFPISGLRAHPEFIKASALIKQAAAEVNMGLGQLDRQIGEAVVRAAQEVVDGQWHGHFVVDVYQAGAGTSHNMNTNEVIANRAIELLGGERGDYSIVHPNDHVNRAQSTNDVFPAAIRLSALSLTSKLLPVISELEQALSDKANAFDDVLKSGRTHLQDAVPIRLGQEFAAYAGAIGRRREHIEEESNPLHRLNLGGTATGTGINAHPQYSPRVAQRLAELTGFPLRPAEDLIEVTQSTVDFAQLSGALKLLALELTRIANDLRLLSSGPRTGLGEITLPAVQPGSSIMPGKVNPVMAEMLNMVCFQVVGNDTTVAMACQAGQLELNVMMPVMAHNLLQSLEILRTGIKAFTDRCIISLVANEERSNELGEQSLGLATALNPYIGYEAAAKVAQEAQATGKTVREVILDKKILSPEELERVMALRRMTQPRELD